MQRAIARSASGCDHSIAHRGRRALIIVAKKQKQQKPQRPKQRKPKLQFPDSAYADAAEDDDGRPVVPVVLSTTTPGAPPPTDQPQPQTRRPEDLYPVFPRQQSSAVSKLPDAGKWSWGDEPPAGAAQEPPAWNPRTGFMKTRADLEQQQQQQEQPESSSSSRPGTTSLAAAAGDTNSSSSWVERLPPSQGLPSLPQQPQQQQRMQAHSQPAAAEQPAQPAAAAGTALPAVSRERVLGSCLASSVAMVGAAALLRVFAQTQAPRLFGSDPVLVEQLLRLPPGLEHPGQAAAMLAAAGAVTGARLLLLQQWPDFRAASERSNQQVLAPLGWPDVALVALLTGSSEELLFRGALIPASLPDARGALLAGLLFGTLHVGGGRNAAFAAWASCVGWLYGGLFLATGNVWVAAGAHSLANFASAAAWVTSNKKSDG